MTDTERTPPEDLTGRAESYDTPATVDHGDDPRLHVFSDCPRIVPDETGAPIEVRTTQLAGRTSITSYRRGDEHEPVITCVACTLRQCEGVAAAAMRWGLPLVAFCAAVAELSDAAPAPAPSRKAIVRGPKDDDRSWGRGRARSGER